MRLPRADPARLTGFPKPESLEAYEAAEREIVTAFRCVPGITSVYRFGTVRLPGVSDLDYAFVYDSATPPAPDALKLAAASLSPQSRYLGYVHPHFLLPTSLFREFQSLRPAKALELVHGPAVPLAPAPDDVAVKRAMFAELVVDGFPSALAAIGRRADVRRHVQLLNAFSYVYEIHRQAFGGGSIPAAEKAFAQYFAERADVVFSENRARIARWLTEVTEDALEANLALLLETDPAAIAAILPRGVRLPQTVVGYGVKRFREGFARRDFDESVARSVRGRVDASVYPQWAAAPIALHEAARTGAIGGPLAARYHLIDRYLTELNARRLPECGAYLPWFLHHRAHMRHSTALTRALRRARAISYRFMI